MGELAAGSGLRKLYLGLERMRSVDDFESQFVRPNSLIERDLSGLAQVRTGAEMRADDRDSVRILG
jgi:hypothetical protein